MKMILIILTLFSSLLCSAEEKTDNKISLKDKDLLGLVDVYAKAKNPGTKAPTKTPTDNPNHSAARAPRQDLKKDFQRPNAPTPPQAPEVSP